MLPVQKMLLHQPPLEEVSEVLRTGLAKNFSFAEVNVVDCPDLSKDPFHLADKGISGQPRIVDLGGPDYLKPFAQKKKNYDFKTVAELSDLPNCLMVGAGAGPNHKVGINCELICNVKVGEGAINKTRIAKIDETTGSYVLEEETSGEFSLMGNFLVSEGKQGKVLQIKAKNRIGIENFVSCIHKTLTAHYGDKAVGLGGTFLLQTGKANIHVMPDFLDEPLITDEQTNAWLKFFEMDAPLIHVGEIVSADPQKLHLRQEHFHCFSHHGQGGHYHYDTTPDDAAYLAYFSVAEFVYRIDLPETRNFIF
ncbi:ester hydrolase C11orf54 homolog [Biomphalaria glabrata]|uniref:Ester hydrolase C11orf54 homolog n=1 Tax=Biomphalaria glabrata TaxID=6526 RepID=A0A2C9JYA8_BIOGL|nr:ester hydrolase C11orf54 homolog [Biomphalaria glabrata]XP_013088648.1 ester hydrolase C11orf54 homolog [Biomphalaria glabrata]XP_055862277.1 ester hydrolase C11orf54 homolog [Biomphalaria glabrata]XP_055862278.1 ester hydrolase C11orf54 homolog [Biomphalaria glabrata]XP_055862279.1 ester hydrolase C11orf54 homolog [Biomphalaria glabrata]KAI8782763.1 ester hydrolase C11orf54 [Biomphalaria glabrata]